MIFWAMHICIIVSVFLFAWKRSKPETIITSYLMEYGRKQQEWLYKKWYSGQMLLYLYIKRCFDINVGR